MSYLSHGIFGRGRISLSPRPLISPTLSSSSRADAQDDSPLSLDTPLPHLGQWCIGRWGRFHQLGYPQQPPSTRQHPFEIRLRRCRILLHRVQWESALLLGQDSSEVSLISPPRRYRADTAQTWTGYCMPDGLVSAQGSQDLYPSSGDFQRRLRRRCALSSIPSIVALG